MSFFHSIDIFYSVNLKIDRYYKHKTYVHKKQKISDVNKKNITGGPLIGRKKGSRRKPSYEKFALWEELKNSISTFKLEAEDHYSIVIQHALYSICLLYTSPSPRD